MPLYEYQCDACGHRFEVIQKFSDPLVDTCSKCGSPVRKLLSSPAIQFKGSGFYINDYAKKSQSDTAKAESDSGKSQSDSGKSQTDAGTKSESSSASSDSGSSSPAATRTSTSDTSTSSKTKKD